MINNKINNNKVLKSMHYLTQFYQNNSFVIIILGQVSVYYFK